MSFLKHITRGGQLQIHQLRMFHQILNFAFLISLVISGLFFCYQVSENLTEKDKQYTIAYMKANCLVSVNGLMPKLDITQKEVLQSLKSKMNLFILFLKSLN